MSSFESNSQLMEFNVFLVINVFEMMLAYLSWKYTVFYSCVISEGQNIFLKYERKI